MNNSGVGNLPSHVNVRNICQKYGVIIQVTPVESFPVVTLQVESIIAKPMGCSVGYVTRVQVTQRHIRYASS